MSLSPRKLALLPLILGFQGWMLACTDIITAAAPNPPADVVATLTGPTTVELRWTARPEAERISSYLIYRNETLAGETEKTLFVDADLSESTPFSYSVTAKSSFAQESSPSPPVSVTTGDGTPPRIIQNFPANGAGPFPIGAVTILVLFSEAMDSATVNSSNFTARVTSTEEPIPGTVSYSKSQQHAQFRSIRTLPPATSITVTVRTGMKDLAGNPLGSPHAFSFTTMETTQPRVIAADPPNGATGVSLTPQIRITFSERMKDRFFDIQLFDGVTGYMPVPRSYDTLTNVLTFLPRLLSNRKYTLTTGWNFPATDLADNPLVPFSISFTTLDAGPPMVVASSPTRDATGVDPATAITMTFNEPMDTSTLNSSTFRVYRFDGGGDMSGAIDYDTDSRVLSFTPAVPLAAETKYVALLLTGAKDVTGVAFEESFFIIFTTK